MNKRIWILYIILIMCIILFIVSENYFAKKTITTIDDGILNDKNWLENVRKDYSDYFGENYLELIKKNGIASNNAKKIYSLFDEDKDGDIIFPKYISGIYINSNNDLVIQLIEKKIPKIYSKEYITYKKVLSSCNNLIIEYVNDLNESGNKVINDLYVY